MVRCLSKNEVPAGIAREASDEVYRERPDNQVSDLEIWIGTRKRESKTVIKESGVQEHRVLRQ